MRKPAHREDRLRAHRRAERRNRPRAGGGTQVGMDLRALKASIGTRAHSRTQLPTLPKLPPKPHHHQVDAPAQTQQRSWWRRVFRRAGS